MTSLAFISLVPAIVMGACASFQKSHLETLKAKHPFALLGDDFGVLNEGDLAWNACEAEPRAFSSDSISYPYWQCFESRSVTFLCDHSGTKAPEKPTDALIVLTVKGLELDQEYLARRPIDIEDCRSFKKEWMRLIDGEKYVCISGPFINHSANEAGKRTDYWVFDKYKTNKGIDSYFDSGGSESCAVR